MAALEVILLTFAAGVAIPVGGLLAHGEHIRHGHLRQDLLHGVIAFGGGALLAAVTLVLVPEGLAHTPALGAFIAFAVGGLGALGLDRLMQRRAGQAGQFTAMMSDFLPESIALGAAVASGSEDAVLLAALIGLQNLPEGFNAYREVCQDLERRWGRWAALGVLAATALLGPLAGLGGLALVDRPAVVGAIELAASGAILALLFQDIAPLAHRRGHVAPALGAVVGFCLGLAGHLWL